MAPAVWDRVEEAAAAARAAPQEHVRSLDPWAVGSYSGESDLLGGPQRAERSFSPANWEPLRAIGAEYEPDSRFFDYLEVS
jgi:hypothetical protein